MLIFHCHQNSRVQENFDALLCGSRCGGFFRGGFGGGLREGKVPPTLFRSMIGSFSIPLLWQGYLGGGDQDFDVSLFLLAPDNISKGQKRRLTSRKSSWVNEIKRFGSRGKIFKKTPHFRVVWREKKADTLK